jgi:hypothetical protein
MCDMRLSTSFLFDYATFAPPSEARHGQRISDSFRERPETRRRILTLNHLGREAQMLLESAVGNS